jgi:hypothetical protein
MTNAHFAFGHLDYRHLAGWHFRSGGGVLFFHGRGGASAIDWNSPVAGAAAGIEQPSMNLPLPPGEVHAIGARRVASSGIVEHSRDKFVLLQRDENGILFGPLAPAEDLTVRVISVDELLLEFSYHVPASYQEPTQFEILVDDGDGTLDPQAVATVPAAAGRTEYSCTLTPARLPRQIAVRPKSTQLSGPTVVMSVPAPAAMPLPTPL